MDALREQLGTLPVPTLTDAFNARVLAVVEPIAWWRALWPQARIVLAGAACSAAATLVLVQLVAASPAVSAPQMAIGPAAGQRVAAGPSPAIQRVFFDRMFKSAGLTAADLASLFGPSPAPPHEPARHDHGSSAITRPGTRTEAPRWRLPRLIA